MEKGLTTLTVRHPKDIEKWISVIHELEQEYCIYLTEQVILDEKNRLKGTGQYLINICASYEDIKLLIPLLKMLFSTDAITFEVEDTELEDYLYHTGKGKKIYNVRWQDHGNDVLGCIRSFIKKRNSLLQF